MQFIVDEKVVNIQNFKLPILISGKCGSGASYFSVAFISKLINEGKKVIYFCLKEPGVDLLREFTAEDSQVTIIEPGNVELFKKTIKESNDLAENVVFVKNIEKTLDKDIWLLLRDTKGCILSGDADLCGSLDAKQLFNTKIYFSSSDKYGFVMPNNVNKFEGYLVTSEIEGKIKITGK